MVLLGLTGGMGMGKSTAARILMDLGVAVVDTDVVARQVVEPGQPAVAEIREALGAEFFDRAGRLDRAALAERVFRDEPARRRLEAILHPRIRAWWLAEADRWRRERRNVGAVVIPLLFESDAAGHFDATLCVACTPEAQRERLAARGWDAAHVAARLRTQLPIDRKLALADFVVWAEGGLDLTRTQLERILQRFVPSCLRVSS